MEWLNELGRRLAVLLRRERFDRDLRDEIRLHMDLRSEEQAARGFSVDEAWAATRRGFGNVTVLLEASADVWGCHGLEQFAQDLRYGASSLSRAPGFTAVAVIVLALGIGANTAIFSIVNAVLLRPLAYKDAGRLVTLLHDGSAPVAVANYVDWHDQSR